MYNKQAMETRKETLRRRNKDMVAKFIELHQVKRIRYDDCISKLAYSFYLSESQVNRILSTADWKQKSQ